MDLQWLADSWPLLLSGLGQTLLITTVAFILALIIGFPLSLLSRGKRLGVRITNRLVALILRGIPELVALYILYYGFGSLGISISEFMAICLALGIIQGAFVGEIYAAGLRTIPKGQHDAGDSLGLSKAKQLRLIIIPQALRFCTPPLINVYISLLKLSVIASAVGAAELLFNAQVVMNQTFEILPVGMLAIIVFIVITLPLTWAARKFEAKISAGYSQ